MGINSSSETPQLHSCLEGGRVCVKTAEGTPYGLEPCLIDLGFPKAILFLEFAVHTKWQVKRIQSSRGLSCNCIQAALSVEEIESKHLAQGL